MIYVTWSFSRVLSGQDEALEVYWVSIQNCLIVPLSQLYDQVWSISLGELKLHSDTQNGISIVTDEDFLQPYELLWSK